MKLLKYFLFIALSLLLFQNIFAAEGQIGPLKYKVDIGIGTGDSSHSPPSMPSGPIFSGPGMSAGAEEAKGALDENISKSEDLKELIIGWTKWLLPLAALLAVVGIVWAGFLYVTAFGDDGQTDKAKKIIMYVVIGILLIFAAYAIVNTIMKGLF